MSSTHFGTLGDQSVDRITIEGGGLTASILTYGAIIQDLRLEEHPFPLVLGLPDFQSYLDHSPYFGAIVGRFANRIRNGQFELDGNTFKTDRNFRSRHTLHGGKEGISERLWSIGQVSQNSLTLNLLDPHMMMGFPGNCEIQCTYSLEEPGKLSIELTCQTDQPTIASLAHHSYFNLDGTSDCRDHVLQIEADHYLPVDDDLIPIGHIQSVSDSLFDFRQPRHIGRAMAYDHNWCLAGQQRPLTQAATVWSHQSGLTLKVSTTEPGLQFYAGEHIDVSAQGPKSPAFGAFSGFCLETQNWPDAPNQSAFPSAIVSPGQPLVQRTEYQFTPL